jgi:DNA-binding MarR family transcriptional regulator
VRERSTLLRERSICNTDAVRDDRLFLEVFVTSQYALRILEHRLAPTGIPPSELGLVTHIRHHQPVTPTAISAASGVPPTTLRDKIQRLVERRLVRRIPHPTDGRSYLLELTPRGEVMARAADPALAEAYAALERLLPKPLEHYQATVSELNAALERSLAELDPNGASMEGEARIDGDAARRRDLRQRDV